MASPAGAEAVAVAVADNNTNANASLNSLADAGADAAQTQPQSQSQSQPQFDASHPSKRKRDDSDDGDRDMADLDQPAPVPLFREDQPLRDEKTLIKNYFHVLQSIDTTPSILKRPLSETSTDDEPASKKQKSDDKPVCIEDKVNQDAYKLLDQLVLDLNKVIGDKNVELRSTAESEDDRLFKKKALAQLASFKEQALDLHHREMAYPQLAHSANADGSINLNQVMKKPKDDKTVLTIFGQAPQPRYLFSSLPKHQVSQDGSDGAVKSVAHMDLPLGLTTTTVLPAAYQKPTRVPTLGEMFPAPGNLPPLEAPKPAKTTTKGKVLGYYHPELTDRSSYGHNKDSYYTKELSTGVWLDYSNAAPRNKNQDRRRDRTLSENSGVDSDVNDMEALFRGAFSSFAPEKDDSGAVISSGELGRLWYQRQGYRHLQQMMQPEVEASVEPSAASLITPAIEEEIVEALENWDESLLDPNLGKEDNSEKAAEDKDLEETLQEVSDLIETLASYQRNRHLTLPTTQSRSATDPAKADLNGSQIPEPSDEERETYQTLKAQLVLIIAGLPPYAVARLNSDKLEELNVSTKIQVKGEVYRGVMEEDEVSARIRLQQQAVAQAAQTPRQAPQRTSTFHSAAAPYQTNPQYNRQFNQTPVPVPAYQQSPVRAQVPPSYQRQASAPMSGMTPQPHRSAAGPFARPSGWNGQQSMQPLRGYNTPGAAQQFAGSPSQPRAASSYQPQAPAGATARYPQGYPAGYTAPQQQQHGVQSQYQQQHSGGIPSHLNGTGVSPQRNPSSQGSPFPTTQGYTPRPTQQSMSQARPYATPGQLGGQAASMARFPSNGTHPSQSQSPAPGNGQGWSAPTPAQLSETQRAQYQLQQQRQMANQERANQLAKMQQNQAAVTGNYHGVSGLSGIGISAHAPDLQKMHMRASQFGGGQASPSPRLPGAASPANMNGGIGQVPSPSPGPMPHGATPSPAPSAALAKPPTPA